MHVYKVARVGVVFVLGFVLVALFFGRTIERGLPRLTWVIPHAATAVFFLTAAAVAYCWRKLGAHSVTNGRAALVGCQALLLFVFTALVARELTDFTVETVHLAKYSLLNFLLFFSQVTGSVRRRAIAALGATLVLGTLEEAMQLWVPLRFFDLRDILLNAVGALSGTGFALLVRCLVQPVDRGPA